MIIDTALPPISLKEVPRLAAAAEEIGFGCMWTSETMHDPFLPGALIAEHTTRIQFGTSVAIAFARSPANLAYTSWDLAQASGGRFILGLGTQVKAHIERRFGQPWPESPVKKLREMVAAVRSFWRAWQVNEKLDFTGDTYRLNLMTPFFNPGPIEHPDIPIYIAGVNTGLARLAGEAAQGFHVHPFHTLKYLKEVILPAIDEGKEKSSQGLSEFVVSAAVFASTTSAETEFIRQQVSFYASTPSYRSVMELHGWGDIAAQLSHLAAGGKWGEMPGLIDNDILSTFAVVCGPDELPQALMERYEGAADRITLYSPYLPGERDGFWKTLVHWGR